MKALSVRQPYAELIMRGEKREEYRTIPTNIRERVYIYAAKKVEKSLCAENGLSIDDLPTGVLVGTVEIAGCRKKGKDSKYAWNLVAPIRAKRLRKPKRKPQPVWFIPF